MDITAIAGMIFSLLVVMMVGGVILLYPLTRRLGAFLEQRLQERQQTTGIDPAEFAELRRAVRSLQAEVARIAEQQAFTESLLQAREQPLLPSDGEQPAGKPREAEQVLDPRV